MRATKRQNDEATKGTGRRLFFPSSLRRFVATSLLLFPGCSYNSTPIQPPTMQGKQESTVRDPINYKPDNENTSPYDISGGAMWRNKADNCIAIYANPADPLGCVEIHVQKVKFKLFGRVGMVQMRWDRLTGRYYPRKSSGAW